MDVDDRIAGLFDDLEQRLRERLAPEEAAKGDRFVRLYYQGAAAADLLAFDPLDLYASALDHYRLAFDRQPGEAKLRIYNPDIERDGWQSTHTVVTIVVDDGPFLIDSLIAALNARGLVLHAVIHPILHVERDANGRLVDCSADGAGAIESFMRYEVDQLADGARLDELRDSLTGVLADVAAATRDWRPMLARLDDATAELAPGLERVEAEEAAEVRAFLAWLAANHFTFLGYARYDLTRGDDGVMLEREGDTGLGILAVGRAPARTFSKLPEEVRARAADPVPPLILTKANLRATVHRSAYLDYIGVKRFDTAGNVVGEHRFLGLFTSAAYSRSVGDIPLLRRKVARLLTAAAFRPASHDGKAFLHIIESYPRDELFQADEAFLGRVTREILHLQDRQRLRLFMRQDLYGRFVSCLVFVPRDRYTTEVRQRFEAILSEAFGSREVQFETKLGDDVLARILFVIRMAPDEQIRDVDTASLERELADSARTWTDRLRSALIEAIGEAQGNMLFQRYAAGLPAGYQEVVPPRLAVPDLQHLARLDSGKTRLAMSLYRPLDLGSEWLRFRLLKADEKIPLATALPMLANMGLTVIDEQPFGIRDRRGRSYWLHDFGMHLTDGTTVDLEAVRERFQEAFLEIWSGRFDDDGFNRLVLAAELDVQDIQVLRTYARYLAQIKIPFSQSYIEDTLAGHPEIARTLAELFRVRFDPDAEGDRDAAINGVVKRIGTLLDQVEVRDEDIIVRAYREVMMATLRTTHFQMAADGRPKSHLAIKVDPTRIRLMPEPKPTFEIFVFATRFEGVHLRGGKVARGGLRWSDRREDFRTEVLGLMKAQQVKNSIIVPVGAKGGFVLKRAPAGDRAALMKEAVSCYETFLSGLLDLTDNRVGGAIVPPPRVVRFDGDDPYLVVAADKGTATFSDYANAVSQAYGFWLDDAFASGGSVGYDHKKMGITARGAWESVKRHFREMGKDCQTQPFTCVGVGDMSGDVFGNGMLLSEQTRLIAAFDHRHIIIDPEPDAATSFVERRRVFDLPRSSWDDYDRSKLSRGGGIWPRTAKSITLSPDARRALGINETQLPPTDVIKAILKAPVDLFWNGGIGTYVKASTERHAEAEDRANDAVRINATELRCRIVGEGGNLGMTQRARIEFATGGGRLNTDFIDNSAGVDCSDHEVNIKVLLGQVVAAGDMTLKQRDTLLAEMTDEVAALVLRDNVLQNVVLSLSEAMPADYLDAQTSLIHRLERDGALDRGLALLPNDEELHERRQAGRGLTRPEHAVLLAHTKNALYEQLVQSPVVDDPYFARDLAKYFPKPLRRRHAAAIQSHGLRREIIATWLANSLVNRGLDVFVNELVQSTGRDVDDIARAYVITRDAFGLLPLWGAIEGLPPSRTAEQLRALMRALDVTIEGTAWFAAHLDDATPMADAVERFASGVDAVIEALPESLQGEAAKALRTEAAAYREAGLEPALADRLAALPYFMAACDVVEVAGETGAPIDGAARTYFALDAALDLGRARRWINAATIRNRWDRLATAGLVDDLYRELRRICRLALVSSPTPGADVVTEVETWIAAQGAAQVRVQRVFAEIDAATDVDLPMISVAVRALGELHAN
ncbi:MAG: NAD-glutamate dehydrogenase [Pseudomonadota bacterium]